MKNDCFLCSFNVFIIKILSILCEVQLAFVVLFQYMHAWFHRYNNDYVCDKSVYLINELEKRERKDTFIECLFVTIRTNDKLCIVCVGLN